jgi:hypothetical protein
MRAVPRAAMIAVLLAPFPLAAQDSSAAPAVLALGESIFKGKTAGGTCFTW